MLGMVIVKGKGESGHIWRILTLLLLVVGAFGGMERSAVAQNLPMPNSSFAEEQDYAFAHGLFKDGLYQLAGDQFEKFTRKFPQSPRVIDARYLRAECLFQLEQYPAASQTFTATIFASGAMPL